VTGVQTCALPISQLWPFAAGAGILAAGIEYGPRLKEWIFPNQRNQGELMTPVMPRIT